MMKNFSQVGLLFVVFALAGWGCSKKEDTTSTQQEVTMPAELPVDGDSANTDGSV